MQTFKEYKELTEKAMDDEFVMAQLADKDINSIVDDNEIIVDKSDVNEAKKILKKIGCKKKVKAQ